MGGQLANRIIFPAPPSSYAADFHNLIWLTPDINLSIETDSEPFPCLLLTPSCVVGSQHTLLYFHGNSCDLGEISEELEMLQEYLDCNVIAFEYPGYGICSSTSTATSCNIDMRARTTFDWLRMNGVPPSSIILFGRSIGTGPASQLAATLKLEGINVGGVILHSPFMSIHQIVSDYAYAIGTWVVANYWDVQKNLTLLSPNTPLLVIHGKNDEIIPFYHGERLYNSYKADVGTKECYFPDDSEHNAYLIIEDIGIPSFSFLRDSSKSRRSKCVNISVDEQYKVIPPQFLQSKNTPDNKQNSNDEHQPEQPDNKQNSNDEHQPEQFDSLNDKARSLQPPVLDSRSSMDLLMESVTLEDGVTLTGVLNDTDTAGIGSPKSEISPSRLLMFCSCYPEVNGHGVSDAERSEIRFE